MNNIKLTYEVPKIEVIVLVIKDIITASDPYVDDIDWDF